MSFFDTKRNIFIEFHFIVIVYNDYFKKPYDSIRSEVLHNTYSHLVWYPHETGKAKKKMRLNETYSRVCVGKNLSDMFPIRNGLKHGDALLPLQL